MVLQSPAPNLAPKANEQVGPTHGVLDLAVPDLNPQIQELQRTTLRLMLQKCLSLPGSGAQGSAKIRRNPVRRERKVAESIETVRSTAVDGSCPDECRVAIFVTNWTAGL